MPLTVERIVSECVGTSVRVVARAVLADRRGRVERLSIEPRVDGVGSTVLVKSRRLRQWSVVSLATELAALGALEAVGGELSPRLLGWSEQAGLLVMTDVGQRTLEQVLAEGDAGEAETALIALASAVAAVHQVHLEHPLLTDHRTWMIGTHGIEWEALAAGVKRLGFPSADRARPDAAAVVEALAHPGRSAAFVHGDITPDNAVIGGDGRCRLVDFEGAGRQHIGVDACMLRFPFAWYGRWAPVPASVQAAMEAAYRSGVDRSREEIDQAIALGCVAMTLLRLNRLALIDDDGQEPSQARRRRVQIVSTLEVAIDAATRTAMFPELVSWFADLVEDMRRRWQEAALRPPVFPAFASGS
ncbi:MAG: aminoglycoside phosphotransferase family protein [Actinomycetota bacterium]|nr:aminoglycoside phosphotransferase family protein [Actinomycetota bacterium]